MPPIEDLTNLLMYIIGVDNSHISQVGSNLDLISVHAYSKYATHLTMNFSDSVEKPPIGYLINFSFVSIFNLP